MDKRGGEGELGALTDELPCPEPHDYYAELTLILRVTDVLDQHHHHSTELSGIRKTFDTHKV